MARLPKTLDPVAINLVGLIASGQRKEAKAYALTVLRLGEAAPAAQKLMAEIFGATRGRPKSGAVHRWAEVGARNDEMRADGLSERERFDQLKAEFHLLGDDDAYIKKVLSQGQRERGAAKAKK